MLNNSPGNASGDASRTERINLRATTQEVRRLRQAAAIARSTLTAFIMSTALREATVILGQSTAPDEYTQGDACQACCRARSTGSTSSVRSGA